LTGAAADAASDDADDAANSALNSEASSAPAGGPRGEAAGRVVDVHAHYLGAQAIERIREEGPQHGVRLVPSADGRTVRVEVAGRLSGLPLLPALVDVEARLAWMDTARIDLQIVSPWMDLAGYDLPGPSALWLARIQNDAAAALAWARPDRFRAAAAVPLHDPVLAVSELRRAVGELDHVAVQIGARVGELGLDDPRFTGFWDAAEELGVPVIVHPAELDVPERNRRLFLHILVGNPADTTFAAAALLLGGVLERRPRLRVLLVHGGGFVPYQIGRIDRGFTAAPPASRSKGAQTPRELVGRLFFDSVLHDAEALRHLARFAAPGHLVLGSDYPFPMQLDRPVETIDAAGLDPGLRQSVLRGGELFRGCAAPRPAEPLDDAPGGPVSPPDRSRSTPSAPPRPDHGGRWTA
jgi:aminocarboxymuconate-semialdehyde decarboxylase